MKKDTFKELARLRQETAVCAAGPGVHLVLRHAEAAAVLRDHRTFSGALGDGSGGEQPILHELEIPDHPRVRALLLFTGLARDAVDRHARTIRRIWRELAEQVAAGTRVDLVDQFARPGVRSSFAEVVGIPEADRPLVYGWISDIREAAATSIPGFQGRSASTSAAAFETYVLEQARLRRGAEDRADDIFTRLLMVEDAAGNTLSDNEIVMLMRLLCQAGIGSTSRSLGNLLYELIRVPDRYRRVRDDRSLVRAAVEESLRHDPPGLTIERVCVRATRLADTAVAPRDVVVVNFGSANRDESVYTDPETFDLDRARLSEHLSFGRGRHRCVGAPLARLILHSALTAFLDRVREPTLDPGYTYKPESFGRWGPRTLDVTLNRKRSSRDDCGHRRS
jgi:cytochrome P450